MSIYRITAFCRRLRLYLPLIWNDYEGDWIPILTLLQFAIRKNRVAMEKNRFIVGWEKECHSQRVAELLIDRILASDYVPIPDPSDSQAAIAAIAREDYLRKQDMTLLCETLRKHLFGWWD